MAQTQIILTPKNENEIPSPLTLRVWKDKWQEEAEEQQLEFGNAEWQRQGAVASSVSPLPLNIVTGICTDLLHEWQTTDPGHRVYRIISIQ
jgi:hypothetical protein